jgi:hypothetical protein
VTRHQLPDRRQPLAGGRARDRRAQVRRHQFESVILRHEAPRNATGPSSITEAPAGLALGLLGVLGFSFSLPATRLAVEDLDPWFVTFSRAGVAAALAGLYLLVVRAPLPTPAQWRRLALVAGGAVIGFPLLTGLALVTSESQHGAVVVALLPAATALAAVARANERPGGCSGAPPSPAC